MHSFSHARFMVLPSAACPAKCSYCFGPHSGPVMTSKVWDATRMFIQTRMAAQKDSVLRLTFHGGEPLVAGPSFFARALPMLAELSPRRDLAVQSNLWLLDQALCRLFRDHDVQLSTSLDGPESISSRQRGPGYFERTMAGIRLAREHGLRVGCVATFTEKSAPRWREVFDFFVAHELDFAVHAAVPSLAHPDSPHILSPQSFGTLLEDMLPYYITNRHEVSVSPFDEMGSGVLTGNPLLCTFGDCLGLFLAIGPAGHIYPCQRFCGNPEFALGNVLDQPDDQQLLDSPAAQRISAWQKRALGYCADCDNVAHCAGGCPYNTFVVGAPTKADPYCTAYRAAFEAIRARLLDEAAGEANIRALAEKPLSDTGHSLFRKGPFIDRCRTRAR